MINLLKILEVNIEINTKIRDYTIEMWVIMRDN